MSLAAVKGNQAKSTAPHAAALVIIATCCLVLLGADVAFFIQNRTLKKEIASPPALLPRVGARIERLEGLSLDGSKVEVPFSGRGEATLLFVFSTECGICNLNWPNWQAIARSVRNEPYRVVYADIQSRVGPDYLVRYGIEDATVLAEVDAGSQVALNLRVTPLTILLNGNGVVMRVWAGLLDRGQLSDLRHVLGLE